MVSTISWYLCSYPYLPTAVSTSVFPSGFLLHISPPGCSWNEVLGQMWLGNSPYQNPPKTAVFVRILKSQVSLSTFFFLPCHFSHSYNYTILFHATFIIILRKSCPGEMKLGHPSPCNVKMSYGKKKKYFN